MTATYLVAARRIAAILLPIAAIAVATLVWSTAILQASHAGELGGDYLAYDGTIRRFGIGLPIYDQSPSVAGDPDTFYYPPTFVVLLLPMLLVPPTAAVWIFTMLSIAATVLAVAVMPVPRETRWVVLLLAGVSWPVAYALKLGQVGPLLLLAASLGWRWLDRPGRLALTIAFGAGTKLQPLVYIGWAVVARRPRVVLLALMALALWAVAALLLFGAPAWFDWAHLLGRLSDPYRTPHDFAPGRLAIEAGASTTVALAVQTLNLLLAGGALLVACLFASNRSSYLVAVVVAQVASPLLWDHYALMLLPAVAWLLSRGLWWAVAIPLSTSVLLIGVTPPVVYLLAYWVTIVALILQGRANLKQEGGRSSSWTLRPAIT
jgi:Glycosyltransferase family 87